MDEAIRPASSQFVAQARIVRGHLHPAIAMITTAPFPYAAFLAALQGAEAPAALARVLPGQGEADARTETLMALLQARRATLQAAFDTTLAADELRRYQKYAKPGKPSAHIVQLRQKQAAARQASSLSRQSLIKAASAFVREAGIEVPERVALDEFIIHWIDANVPRDAIPS
ncbi:MULTISPECIES: hypothetical protein [unclassified Dyella]|uniref:hypothetical protein n=1 Tax=unclassified Dyella TaxID=2634549 RepID=UPI003F8E0928